MSEGRAQRILVWLSVGEKRVKDNGQDELGDFGEGEGDLGCKVLREIWKEYFKDFIILCVMNEIPSGIFEEL